MYPALPATDFGGTACGVGPPRPSAGPTGGLGPVFKPLVSAGLSQDVDKPSVVHQRLSKIHRMSWIRRRARDAEPPSDRLPDLEFLALVKASLEEYAPGVTQGAEFKGSSLISPSGWVVAVAPPHHGGGRHVLQRGQAGGGEPSYPSTRLDLVDTPHTHDAACGCGGHLDPEHPGFDFPLPHLVAELSEEERAQRVTVDTGAIMITDGVGNFLKVRLPVRLDDGRTVVYLAWVYLQAEVIDEFTARVRNETLTGYRFEGLLCNAVGPWGEELLRAPVVLGGQQSNGDGSIRRSEVIASSHPLLGKVLREPWPSEFVLGDRDPRLRTG